MCPKNYPFFNSHKLFTPIFLHRYICHIWDILQLCMYDGILDLLLPVSRWSYKNLGRTWNLVSILTDFLTAFLQNGTTMRGFYQSYQSKCVMKYDMKETDLIDWRTLHTACVEFLEKLWILTRKNTCGPIPRALVEDGIAMEMQISKLIPGEIKKHSKTNQQNWNTRVIFPGQDVHQAAFKSESFNGSCQKRNMATETEKSEKSKMKRRKNEGMISFWCLLYAFLQFFVI